MKKSPAKKKATAVPAPSKLKPLVSAQPQSNQQAAANAGIFLYTDDVWSQAYFKSGDLHCMERELFG